MTQLFNSVNFVYRSVEVQIHLCVLFLFRVHVSHPYVAVENMHVRIIRNFIFLIVALLSFLQAVVVN